MTSRERMMIALENGRPDRLPCQVHGWMLYYLNRYLDGMDWYQAYEKFGMDYAIYISPDYRYDENDLAKWEAKRADLGIDDQGNHRWDEIIETPEGTLHHAGAWSDVTAWETEVLIKSDLDFELWNKYCPVPVAADFAKIHEARERLGDNGIVRSHPFSPGQGSPWQSFCTMVGTESAIMLAMDDPALLHEFLERILQKTLRVTELWQGIPSDVVEIGGGAGSNTVISPAMFREFCLPYDRQQVRALHYVGLKVVYHLCGGLMQMLDLVVETGADGLETMTPPSMGGDCDLREASRRVGDKLFFIGGFDQNTGFERGTPKVIREMVYELHRCCPNGGYVCSPSDHFFFGAPANIQAFVDAVKECVY